MKDFGEVSVTTLEVARKWPPCEPNSNKCYLRLNEKLALGITQEKKKPNLKNETCFVM